MANTEWWQRGPIDGIPAVLQPVAHILLQVRESVGEIVEPLTEQEWNETKAALAVWERDNKEQCVAAAAHETFDRWEERASENE